MNTTLILAAILLSGLIFPQLVDRLKLFPRRFRFKIPAVTIWLLIGIVIGPSVLKLVPIELNKASFFISNLVLGIIAFSLGQNFTRDLFRKTGRVVMWVSILGAVGPWLLVCLGLTLLLHIPFYISLVFGAIAAATAPAATIAVIREAKARGHFTDVLLGVVAIDDAWCLIIFAVSLALAKAYLQHMAVINSSFFIKVLATSLWKIGGALVLGGIVAVIFIKLSRFARTAAELLIYTLGLILLTTGTAIFLGLSVLLTNMCLGAILINLDKTSFTFLESLRTVETPLYLIFFVLAGASFQLSLFIHLGWLGLAYIVLRAIGKLGGASLGGVLGHGGKDINRFIGWGLLPQAGVAMGAALVAKSVLPAEWGNMVSTIIIGSTVFYELIGPVLTRIALEKVDNVKIGTDT